MPARGLRHGLRELRHHRRRPLTFNSDTVNSFEVGAKNNFDNRVKIASSIYYIRWNNIQQTVVPPICQISFIANLGQGGRQGRDIQAEIALTDNFTAGTRRRLYRCALHPGFAPDARGRSAGRCRAGDAIAGQSGQPGAPFTVTIGLEYKFKLFNAGVLRARGR